jgi:Tfp pilus assembly protein PilF
VQDLSSSLFRRREVIALSLLVVVAGAIFFVTRSAAVAHRRLRLQDAETWYSIGETRLAAGDARGAAEALRRATAISRDNQTYQLTLATALSEAHAINAARLVLLQLRERSPESAEINLRLARLDASRGDVSAAIRYYQSAVHGIWPTDTAEPRQSVRLEFIRYLLRHDQKRRALAELLVLDENLPSKSDVHLTAGGLFMQADDPSRALAHFELALKLDARAPDALVGAGQAAFALGDYYRARRYLQATVDSRATELRRIVELVLTRDPLAPRLSARERRRRLTANLNDVNQRLSYCASDGAQALLVQTTDFLARLEKAREADGIIDDGLELIRRVEEGVPASCPTPRSIDRALLIIARRHAGAAS